MTIDDKPRARHAFHDDLTASPIYRFGGGPAPLAGMNPLVPIDNHATIDLMRTQMLNDTTGRVDWLVLVPGTSEVGGHHHAYVPVPGDRPGIDVISPEFRARLDHAHALLKNGLVPFLMISGGSVDTRPGDESYNEANNGLRYLLGNWGGQWPAGELARRVIVEPWAIHTECNVRNADRLALLLGLDRITIVTTARVGHMEDQGSLFDGGSTLAFDALCSRWLGYKLGNSQARGEAYHLPWDTNGQPGVSWATKGFLHYNFDASRAQILGDVNWALGAREIAGGSVHTMDAYARD